MVAELFPSSQLGSKDDLIDQMIAGEPVITTGNAGYFADCGAPDMGITLDLICSRTGNSLTSCLQATGGTSSATFSAQRASRC